MSSVPVWIDTDTGVDDAIALMAAIALQRQKKLEIVGISAVCGNAEQARTFENARNVVNLAGRPDIPVYPGASKPIMVELQTAAYVHGEDGLGGAVLPASKAARETEMAWDALYRCAREWKGELELILIGPETNAAIAFQKYPDLKNYLKRILIMGGAAVGGNRTPAAEFNIWVDPHAAQIVFKSQVPIIMCGLDVTMRAELNSAKIDTRESYQRLSIIMREFVSSMTGKNVTSLTLYELKEMGFGPLSVLIADCYAPEFAMKTQANFRADAEKAKGMVRLWN